MVVHTSFGLSFDDGAEETIHNCLEEDGVDVRVILECGMDSLWQHGQRCWRKRSWYREWHQRFSWGDI